MTNARELAGSVLTTGIPGPSLDAATRSALEEIAPSGVILFRRNIESPERLRELTASLHALPSRPLVSIDHEGGKVVRVGPPFTDFPPARSIQDAETAEQVGRAIGSELASVGIDIDFAPILDVDSNPDNPIIGERAYSRDPTVVAERALAFARGMHSAGIIACGKHFPGHGDTDRDSHLELPVVNRTREQLEEIELVPFRAAAKAGIPMIMTAHVVYPALDPINPATVSPSILGELLRKDLGYEGIIVSDDLEMRALSKSSTVPDAAVASLQAGCDWLLVCNDFDNTVATAQRLTNAISNGELDRDRIRTSSLAIRSLRPARSTIVELPCDAHIALRDRILAGHA